MKARRIGSRLGVGPSVVDRDEITLLGVMWLGRAVVSSKRGRGDPRPLSQHPDVAPGFGRRNRSDAN